MASKACKRNRNARITKLALNGNKHSKEEWKALCYFYGFKCLACGKSGKKVSLTKDHIIPICKGGGNDIYNLQVLCKNCNIKKDDKIIDYREILPPKNLLLVLSSPIAEAEQEGDIMNQA